MSGNFNFEEEFSKLKRDTKFKNAEPVDADAAALFGGPSGKKKKKDKKKSKKGRSYKLDKIGLLMDPEDLTTDGDISNDDFLIIKKAKAGSKKDLFDIKEAKKKKKEDMDARFNPEILLLRKVLKDSELSTDQIDRMIAQIESSKARGVGKLLTDLMAAKNSSISTRAAIINNIANIKRTASDLTLKYGKGKKDDSKSDSHEDYGTKLISSLFSGGGRKELTKKAKAAYRNRGLTDDEVEDLVLGGIDDDEGGHLDILKERLAGNEELGYRTAEGNAYIKYEDMQPVEAILLSSNGEYDTIAIDKYGNKMPDDYPVVPKENLGRVTFNHDNMIATDEYGRTYRLIETPEEL